jgi:hypothetical protein
LFIVPANPLHTPRRAQKAKEEKRG